MYLTPSITKIFKNWINKDLSIQAHIFNFIFFSKIPTDFV